MVENHLHYGGNLGALRGYIAGESVELVYLDLPFNSNEPGLRKRLQDRGACLSPAVRPVLQPFCNPNPRSAMAFVGTPWESGP